MRGKKVTAIKRIAREQNNTIDPEKKDMKLLKKFNKGNSIPQIKRGGLMYQEFLEPMNINIINSDKVRSKTIGRLSLQRKFRRREITINQ